jgi:hypothetical protein
VWSDLSFTHKEFYNIDPILLITPNLI